MWLVWGEEKWRLTSGCKDGGCWVLVVDVSEEWEDGAGRD